MLSVVAAVAVAILVAVVSAMAAVLAGRKYPPRDLRQAKASRGEEMLGGHRVPSGLVRDRRALEMARERMRFVANRFETWAAMRGLAYHVHGPTLLGWARSDATLPWDTEVHVLASERVRELLEEEPDGTYRFVVEGVDAFLVVEAGEPTESRLAVFDDMVLRVPDREWAHKWLRERYGKRWRDPVWYPESE